MRVPFTIRLAVSSDFERIHALYELGGYHGGFTEADEILVASSDSELLGVVRLCSEGGVTVLRGMQVHTNHRRMAIGSSLLDACAVALRGRTCFCLPFDHLVDFYGQVGFRLLDEREFPLFLQERLQRYRSSGFAVVPMVRPPS